MNAYAHIDAQHQAVVDDGIAYQDALTQSCENFQQHGCCWIAGELVTWDSFSEWFHNDCEVYNTWVRAMSKSRSREQSERIAKTYRSVVAMAESEWLELMFDEYCEKGG